MLVFDHEGKCDGCGRSRKLLLVGVGAYRCYVCAAPQDTGRLLLDAQKAQEAAAAAGPIAGIAKAGL
jgi:hypothetical protein